MNRFDAAQLAAPEVCSQADDLEEPPSRPTRHPKWREVPDSQWDDWRWQMQNAIRTTAQLAEFYDYSSGELSALSSLENRYKLAIPPYYFSLIDTRDPRDPIGLQSLPSIAEQASTAGVELDELRLGGEHGHRRAASWTIRWKRTRTLRSPASRTAIRTGCCWLRPTSARCTVGSARGSA